MRVLLVEDDELLGDGLCTGLKYYSYTVDWVRDGQHALDALQARNESFDTVVLDLGLPNLSGLDVLRSVRNNNINVPVLILTARESIEDRVKGLDAGADDYLTKPFKLEELTARMRALQRRSKARATPTIRYGEITLDPASHMIYQDNEQILISRREFALLQKLLENAGRVISREQLNQTLYGWGESIDSNALEVHIHNLRKRFGSKLIRTIRGVGYMAEKIEQ
ncbi:MAG: DNA-binding response regulator [Gammaproteobacteria bacterium RIFCSPHIGHO2_12_FULL_41_15]|nr:MAG: DNA-binding response regulator [Gammaproteobacteria bacterium RIFCSPHIGHO2_12_FULL_41_15]